VFSSDKNLFLEATEKKPNRYAAIAMLFYMICMTFCWFLTEIGVFLVGKTEMRIGAIATVVSALVPLILMKIKPNLLIHPAMKYVIMLSSFIFTLAITTFLTFHTMSMLLFPMFLGMIYRSKNLGIMAFLSSALSTVIAPVLGYLLRTWDILFFERLILLGTDVDVHIAELYEKASWNSVGQIFLFIIMPRLLMVGACAILMFYVIRVGVDHVKNQLQLTSISHRDALTGLFNRNYLTDVMGDRSFSGVCTVFFFDVNGLKSVNDRMGHEAGDLMLRGCADCLRELCDEDTSAAFRMGGDEFLMLSFSGKDLPAKTVEKINAALREVSATTELRDKGIVCSMAAGFATGDFADIEKLIRTADANMYENKKASRA